MRYPDVDGDFDWNSGVFCKDDQISRHTQTFTLDFGSDKQLTVVERTADDEGRRGWGEVHTQGAVIFRRAGPDTPDAAVTLEVTVTDDRLPVYSSWNAETGSLEIIVPHRVEWSTDRPRACVNVMINIWVPENAELKHLSVESVHLDIKLLDNLSLSVLGGIKLGSTVGAITSASTGTTSRDDQLIDAGAAPDSFTFNSRIIDVRTTAAPIKGIWPLYDYLGLQSTAGNIKVCIDPKPVLEEAPKPATLYLKSLSGDVSFREPIHTAEATFRIGQSLPLPHERRQAELRAATVLPPRDYRVDVHTTSGDITGAAAFSSAAGFKSTSGTISLDLLPVLDSMLAEDGAREVALSTASTSGATDVNVLEPLWVDGGVLLASSAGGEGKETNKGKGVRGGYVVLKAPSASSAGTEDGGGDNEPTPLRCLHSIHSTTSANIKVVLPGSWEGEISESSLTGLLQVDGEGVKLIKAGSDWPGVNKMLLARKGEKGVGGKTAAKSTSGDVAVYVGRK
jgi:hypothetical protein